MEHTVVRRIVLAGVAFLAACAAPEKSGGLDPAPTLESLALTPPSITLDPGDSLDFDAVGHFDDGSTADVPVIWIATGGTVTVSGRYRAGGTPGQFRVIVQSADQLLADTAVVTVRDTTAPITMTGISLAPDSAVLDPGQVALFSATGHYSDGGTAGYAASWAATGGTVSTGGSYTAGPVAGSYRVVASGSGFADTARITIRDTTSPPPPPPPPPPGGTVLVAEGFDDATVGSRGWYDNTNPAIASSGQRTGAGALQMSFNAGATTPVKGGALRHKFTGTDRVYLRFWVKYSANWVGSGVNYHPHEFYFVTDVDGDWIGPSATHLTTYVEHLYNGGGGKPRLSLTDALNIDGTSINQDLSNVTESRAVAGCNGNTDGYPTGCYQAGTEWRNEKIFTAAQPAFTPATQASWHKVEAYFQLNTISGGKGISDGVAQYWFDGQLVIDKHDVLFRTAQHPTMKFNQFLIGPYIGVGSPLAQGFWVDDLVIATGPVP